MRYLLSAGALATFASAAFGQQSGQPNAQTPSNLSPVTLIAPECSQVSAAAGSTSSSDQLCVSRASAIAATLRANPQLEIAGAIVQQNRAARVQSVALPDPSLGAEWDGAKAPFGIGGASSRTLGASITIPFYSKFGLNGKIGNANIAASEADSITLRQGLASQASQTYDSLLAALRHHANLLEADSLAKDFQRKAQSRFDAGSVARLEVLNAQVAVAQTGNDLIANERDIANGRSSLNRLLGRPLGAPLLTSDTLSVPELLPTVIALETAALEHRPELASLRQQQASAKSTTSLTRAFWLPDFTLGISKDFLGDPSPGYLSTGISMPIPLIYKNHSHGEIAQSEYIEQQLNASYRDLQAAIGQEVRVAFASAATSLRQAVFIRDQLLPAARQAYQIAATSYSLGGSSALEVNSARAALVDAESQYTDALAAANSARAELERAAATPLTTLGTGAP